MPELNRIGTEYLLHEPGSGEVILPAFETKHAIDARSFGKLQAVAPFMRSQLKDRCNVATDEVRPLEERRDFVSVTRNIATEGLTAKLKSKPPWSELSCLIKVDCTVHVLKLSVSGSGS